MGLKCSKVITYVCRLPGVPRGVGITSNGRSNPRDGARLTAPNSNFRMRSCIGRGSVRSREHVYTSCVHNFPFRFASCVHQRENEERGDGGERERERERGEERRGEGEIEKGEREGVRGRYRERGERGR